MNIEIVKLNSDNIHIYENLCQPYEAEFSPLTGELPNVQGLYKFQELKVGSGELFWGGLCYVDKMSSRREIKDLSTLTKARLRISRTSLFS